MGRANNRGPLVDDWIGARNIQNVFVQSRDWEKALAREYWDILRAKIRAAVASYIVTAPDDYVAAAAFCALSPNNSEDGNLKDLSSLWMAYSADDTNRCSVHTYKANKVKAIRIFRGEDPDVVLPFKTSPKTNTMYHNIMNRAGEPDRVTIDGHMVSVWQGKRLTMDQAGITPKEYQKIQLGIAQFARQNWWNPAEMQALLWMTWKRIHKVLYKPQMKLEL